MNLPLTRAETICPDHDKIRYAIWCAWYDMFRDVFSILSWEAEACDPGLRTPPITTACAIMMRNGYINGGLLRVSRCSVFVMNLLLLLEYTGCYPRYLMFISNFGKCYNCTVSYRIFLRVYRDMYRSLCIGGITVCHFSPTTDHNVTHMYCMFKFIIVFLWENKAADMFLKA